MITIKGFTLVTRYKSTFYLLLNKTLFPLIKTLHDVWKHGQSLFYICPSLLFVLSYLFMNLITWYSNVNLLGPLIIYPFLFQLEKKILGPFLFLRIKVVQLSCIITFRIGLVNPFSFFIYRVFIFPWSL